MTDNTNMPLVEELACPGWEIREFRPEVAEQVAKLTAGAKVSKAFCQVWEDFPGDVDPIPKKLFFKVD